DLNGRTGNHICCADSPPRSSLDTVSNARGNWILQLGADNGLHILNGTSFKSSSPGQLTSFQPMGASVIDYVLASTLAVDDLRPGAMNISKSLLSDHAALELTI
ncbi:hypothetical protein EV368DRAFT_8283, partial [Lentinula lateritia]